MTITAGAIITAADFTGAIDALNARLNDLEGERPTARSAANGTLGLTNVTPQALVFNSLSWDNDNITPGTASWSTHTATRDGRWTGVAQVVYEDGSAGSVTTTVEVNGSTVIAQDSRALVNTYETSVMFPFDIFLSEGDVVRLIGYQDSGGGLDVIGSSLTTTWEANIT